jgi:hypothetical protein
VKKYSSVFNYQREIITMETEAETERQAWEFFCHGLAARHGVKKRVMMNYFSGNKPNFEIMEATPWQNTK